MSRSLTDRYLQRLRLRLAVLYAVAMAVALGILVYVVVRVDADLRWSDMNEALLSKAQETAGSVVFTDDGSIVIDRFVNDTNLTEGWPQAWLFERSGDEVYALAGPVEDWYDADLDSYAEAVLFNESTYMSWVGDISPESEVYARGVAILDPGNDQPRVAAIAVTESGSFYADHDRLADRVRIAAAFLVGAAAWAGYWMAGRGTRATGEALAQQERLLSDAAHELRTPVAKIRAVADSGLAGDESAEDALGRVARLGEDAGQMVDDMLFLARLDADREELNKEPLRLDQLVEELAGRFEGVEVSAVATVVEGDPGLLRRAISNLIRNAINHGGGDVKVTVYPSTVIVTDNGDGIDPAVAAHVFERFHTGPTSGGHGLGLPIVKWITETHDGTITLENRPEGGAIATLTLPG
ncbi:MAG: HAMP domain-containing histidine kinase [bacterium]|nr:HAMP domain-containing histidine kinase [bacterium]